MLKLTQKQVRYSVTVLSVIAGIVYTCFDSVRSGLPAPSPGPAGQMSPAQSRFAFDACVTFYGTVYWCGRHLYGLLRRQAARDELERWSTWHLRVLNVLGSAWLLHSSWQSYITSGVIRPAILVSILLLVQTLRDIARGALPAKNAGRPSRR